MHIEFLLEERSAEEALKLILPKILPNDVSFYFHVFEGKQDLLKKLPARLRGYYKWIPEDWRIIVLIDEDRKCCQKLKAKLEEAASNAGFVTKSRATQKSSFQVVTRLAIEELEAWFFGDPEAIKNAYPKVSKTFQHQVRYRDSDAIPGGTFESLERLLIRASHCQGRLSKIAAARNIAPHMEPSRNRSKSFQVFVEGLKACIGKDSLS